MDTIGNFLSTNSGAIGSALGTGAQLYGQQNAAEAITSANTTAANTQQQYLGTAGSYYQPYLQTGAGAETALGSALGTNGSAPDYSGFENMPGYQFAIQQGTQAIQRQAAASGSAYTPNTQAAVGQYVTGTAMQDYNTYIGQLQAAAGVGQTSANQIGNMTYNTGANISQLAANSGQAQAGLYTGAGQTVGGALGAGNPYTGYNATGSGGGLSGLISGGVSGIGNLLTGNTASQMTNYFGSDYGTGGGYSPNNGYQPDDTGDYGFGVPS